MRADFSDADETALQELLARKAAKQGKQAAERARRAADGPEIAVRPRPS